MNLNFIDYISKITKATFCREDEVIQLLWSGCGQISRYVLESSLFKTVIVKHINLDKSIEHPRGWNTSFSHQRKIKSYQVETNWYNEWSEFCDSNCKIPKMIGSFTQENNQWIVLEDLKEEFPLIKTQINLSEVKVCLKWLANFHVNFLNKKPNGLWEVGTYWHLATRPDELKKIEHNTLKEKAHLIDDVLNNCKYQTIVHGDAKLANFCFSEDGTKVAAVDFQYVGGGCGMKDVAYFLGSCLTNNELETYETELLNYYFDELHNAFNTTKFSFDFVMLEKEWRQLYPLACADFMRFLLGWMPTHQKINNYNKKIINSVLANL